MGRARLSVLVPLFLLPFFSWVPGRKRMHTNNLGAVIGFMRGTYVAFWHFLAKRIQSSENK